MYILLNFLLITSFQFSHAPNQARAKILGEDLTVNGTCKRLFKVLVFFLATLIRALIAHETLAQLLTNKPLASA